MNYGCRRKDKEKMSIIRHATESRTLRKNRREKFTKIFSRGGGVYSSPAERCMCMNIK